MISVLAVALLARLAIAAPSVSVNLAPGDSATTVIATVTNTGNEDVSLLKWGSILSDLPIKQFDLHDVESGNATTFGGMIGVFYDMSLADENAWQFLPAGASATSEIDFAGTHLLDAPGDYLAITDNVFEYVEGQWDGQTPSGVLPYTANATITISNEGVAASKAKFAAKELEKRVKVEGCPDAGRKQTLINAYGRAHSLATNAANVAKTGTGTIFNKWFKSNSQADRNTVGAMFDNIGVTTNVGEPAKFSTNCQGSCSAGVVAYAAIAMSNGQIVGGTVYMCDPFWTFPLNTPECPGGNGQADVLVHEVSHLYGTLDTVYGVDGSLALNHDQAMHNADNYRYYARSEWCVLGW
ncbi:Deuterolysin metalloprotease family-domain-containing protein [Schizophyllum commune]